MRGSMCQIIELVEGELYALKKEEQKVNIIKGS